MNILSFYIVNKYYFLYEKIFDVKNNNINTEEIKCLDISFNPNKKL